MRKVVLLLVFILVLPLNIALGSRYVDEYPDEAYEQFYEEAYEEDGIYTATVYSYSSGSYYTLDVEIEGDTAIINFPNGGYIVTDIESRSLGTLEVCHARTGNYYDIELY